MATELEALVRRALRGELRVQPLEITQPKLVCRIIPVDRAALSYDKPRLVRYGGYWWLFIKEEMTPRIEIFRAGEVGDLAKVAEQAPLTAEDGGTYTLDGGVLTPEQTTDGLWWGYGLTTTWKIARAKSTDGETWTHDRIVLDLTPQGFYLMEPRISYADGKYYLSSIVCRKYLGFVPGALILFESTDGVSFTSLGQVRGIGGIYPGVDFNPIFEMSNILKYGERYVIAHEPIPYARPILHSRVESILLATGRDVEEYVIHGPLLFAGSYYDYPSAPAATTHRDDVWIWIEDKLYLVVGVNPASLGGLDAWDFDPTLPISRDYVEIYELDLELLEARLGIWYKQARYLREVLFWDRTVGTTEIGGADMFPCGYSTLKFWVRNDGPDALTVAIRGRSHWYADWEGLASVTLASGERTFIHIDLAPWRVRPGFVSAGTSTFRAVVECIP